MTSTTIADLSTLDSDFPILANVTADNVTHTETRLGEPVAVVDFWMFGAQWAQWSNENPLIVFDIETWDTLSETSKDYVVAHEAAERDLARNAGDVDIDHSPSEITDRYHDEANRVAVEMVGENAAIQYARETFDLANEQAFEQVTYVLRGVEYLVPNDLTTDR